MAIGAPQLPAQAPVPPGPYPWERRAGLEEAISEAWAWLEGSALLVKDRRYAEPNTARVLSRRARQLAAEPDARRALSVRRIPKDALHPEIREDVWALYHRGKFDTAVLEAMKAVEIAVRAAAGYSDSDLVRTWLRGRSMKTTDRFVTRTHSKLSALHYEIYLLALTVLTKTLTRIETLLWMIPTRLPRSSCWQTICCALSTPGGQQEEAHEAARPYRLNDGPGASHGRR